MEAKYRAAQLRLSTSKGRMHRERKIQKPRLESGGADANGRCRFDVADFCILVEQYHPGASHDPKTTTPVELLTFEEISDADPVFTTALGGYLKYLGQEKLLLAGREWLSDKFELKVATHAPFLLWTSSQGLLLEFKYEKDSRVADEGMILASFHD